MDKIGRRGHDDPYRRRPILEYNDRVAQGRGISRAMHLDPGTDPALSDSSTRFIDSSSPTLEALTTHAYEHPAIGDPGVPRMPVHSRRTINGE